MLHGLTDRITAAGSTVVTGATDLRNQEDVTALVKTAVDRFGQIDALVSNAGIGPRVPPE